MLNGLIVMVGGFTGMALYCVGLANAARLPDGIALMFFPLLLPAWIGISMVAAFAISSNL